MTRKAVPSNVVRARRGAGIVVIVLLLAALQLVVVGSVVSSGDEATLSTLRVDGVRGFYAGESGGLIGTKTITSSLTTPVAGTTVSLGNASLKYVSVPDPLLGGDLVIEGTSGQSIRRVKVRLADPTIP